MIMRAWLAISGLFVGLLVGAIAPNLVACRSCEYHPPALGTYAIVEAPVPAFLGGKVEVVGPSAESSGDLIIRYEWDGRESEIVYHLVY
jgi:hypothetical protein